MWMITKRTTTTITTKRKKNWSHQMMRRHSASNNIQQQQQQQQQSTWLAIKSRAKRLFARTFTTASAPALHWKLAIYPLLNLSSPPAPELVLKFQGPQKVPSVGKTMCKVMSMEDEHSRTKKLTRWSDGTSPAAADIWLPQQGEVPKSRGFTWHKLCFVQHHQTARSARKQSQKKSQLY